MGDHQNEQPIIIARNQDNQILQDSASAGAANICNHHAPCTTFGYSGATNSMKRRSPSSCLSQQDPSMAVTEPESEPRAKKLFFEHDELTNNGFSSISLPMSPGMLTNENPCHLLRRCRSDPSNPPGAATGRGFPVTPFHSPEHANMAANPPTPASVRGFSSASGLPPLPPSLKRCVSDPTPSPSKSLSLSSSSEDTHSSMV